MKCPRCENAVLDEREREGVVIDACPQCRGIWLDRGELEKIVTRATQELESEDRDHGPRSPDSRDQDSRGHERRDHERRDYDSDAHHGVPSPQRHSGDYHHRSRRKRHWFETLGDLFD